MGWMNFFCTWFRSWSHLCCFKCLRLWAVESILKIYLIIFNFRYIVCCWSKLPNNVLSITINLIIISILTSTCLRTYFRLYLLSCIGYYIFILIRFLLLMIRWKRVLHLKKVFRAMLLSHHILLTHINSNRWSFNCASYFLNVLIEHINIGP